MFAKTAEVATLRAARQASVDAQAHKAASAKASVDEALEGSRAALCELAASALRSNLAPKTEAQATLEALQRARAAADDALLMAATPDAYDKAVFMNGVITAAVGAVVIIATLIWLAA